VLEPALGSLGLLMIALLGWAVERLQTNRLTDAVLARLAFAFVATVGWMIDRLPLPGLQPLNQTAVLRSTENTSTLTESSRLS
jgi:hypothetical protein